MGNDSRDVLSIGGAGHSAMGIGSLSDAFWVGLFSLLVLVINTWRSEVAARRAGQANDNAVRANEAAVSVGVTAAKAAKEASETRKEQAMAIEQVQHSVNGGLADAKAEIVSLKEQLIAAKASDAEPPLTPTVKTGEYP